MTGVMTKPLLRTRHIEKSRRENRHWQRHDHRQRVVVEKDAVIVYGPAGSIAMSRWGRLRERADVLPTSRRRGLVGTKGLLSDDHRTRRRWLERDVEEGGISVPCSPVTTPIRCPSRRPTRSSRRAACARVTAPTPFSICEFAYEPAGSYRRASMYSSWSRYPV